MKQFRNTNYCVSEDGKIFNIKTNRQLSTQIIKDKSSTFPRERVGLSINKSQRWFVVARIVAECYIPNPENKPQVNHKDGNPLNNHYSNLEWCTQSENIIHAINTGLKLMMGVSNPSSKLNPELVLQAKIEYQNSNINLRHLAMKYNVSYTSIQYAIKGITWK